MPNKTYLICSEQSLGIGAGSSTANVPTKSGGREDVIYTAMVKEPKEIEWPDKKIVWEGAEEDIQNIRSNGSSPEMDLIAKIAVRIGLRRSLFKSGHDGINIGL